MSVGDSLDKVHVEATIDMASVDTNNHDRDTHLRSTDFFSTDLHPTMRFSSTEILDADGSWIVRGDLTINTVTRPVTLDVEFNGVQPVQDELHAGFSASIGLRRSDFGIDFGLLPAGADRLVIADAVAVELELELQFIEPTR